jgi:hypothetical protein
MNHEIHYYVSGAIDCFENPSRFLGAAYVLVPEGSMRKGPICVYHVEELLSDEVGYDVYAYMVWINGWGMQYCAARMTWDAGYILQRYPGEDEAYFSKSDSDVWADSVLTEEEIDLLGELEGDFQSKWVVQVEDDHDVSVWRTALFHLNPANKADMVLNSEGKLIYEDGTQDYFWDMYDEHRCAF